MALLRCLLLGSLLASAACSDVAAPDEPVDPDWMLGTFSSAPAGPATYLLLNLVKYRFDAGGGGLKTRWEYCKSETIEELPFTWEPRSEGTVAIVREPGADTLLGGPDQEVRFIYQGCDERGRASAVPERVRSDGVVESGDAWWRGDVCPELLPPCEPGSECDSCRAVWCDEAEPLCSAP